MGGLFKKNHSHAKSMGRCAVVTCITTGVPELVDFTGHHEFLFLRCFPGRLYMLGSGTTGEGGARCMKNCLT